MLGMFLADIFTPKLLTMREKMIGHHSCFHRPGGVSLCE
jgi:hypothetical protein